MASATPTSNNNRLVKITLFIKKKDSISHEEFHRYWSEEHSKIFLSLPISRRNLVKYSQYHSDTSIDLTRFGFNNMLGYDGVASLWANSFEELLAIFTSEDFRKTLLPDEDRFINRAELVSMVGWDEDKWDNGKTL
ncbi:EthD domain-containing protein [Annulohypoxylon truncatum]|uniref:EthD domain-containing protein n=1 Tax=Annulohypoxylon truncatum TaxID=327061 RepID=UPI002008A892|nr:EthD domain-containing protein [Annulohypoxylon truncatum]KAI1211365.1 EthD domain-containing protein [Annulohypoxylon truncatum]